MAKPNEIELKTFPKNRLDDYDDSEEEEQKALPYLDAANDKECPDSPSQSDH